MGDGAPRKNDSESPIALPARSHRRNPVLIPSNETECASGRGLAGGVSQDDVARAAGGHLIDHVLVQ